MGTQLRDKSRPEDAPTQTLDHKRIRLGHTCASSFDATNRNNHKPRWADQAMRVSPNSVLTAFLSLLLMFLISDVDASRHRHQHQLENSVSSFVDSSKSSSSSSEMTHQTSGSTRTTKQKRSGEQVGSVEATLPDTSPNRAPDLMRQYLSRNMYQCSSKYVGTLSKLHALIKEAYEEYKACQEQLQNQKKTYSKTSFAALDQLLAEWKDEDEQGEGSSEEDSFEVDPLRPTGSHH